MSRFHTWSAILCLSLFSIGAAAVDIPLQNIDETDFKNIVKDFSANFTHTSVSGASTLGKLFGVELGLIGGMTNTKDLDRLAKEADSNAKADKIPHAAILGVVTVPLGLTGEVGLIPKMGSDRFKYSQVSAALKWTPTESLLELPLSLALKAHIAKNGVEFAETINDVNTQFDYDSTVTGLTLLASKDFVIIEPYVGLGLLSGKGKLDATGSAVFDPSLTTAQSASASESSTLFLVGAEVKLLIFKAGLEYSNLFDTSRYTGKLAFFF